MRRSAGIPLDESVNPTPKHITQPGGELQAVGVRGVPLNLVVDEYGTAQAAGVTTPDEVAATLQRLLGENPTG